MKKKVEKSKPKPRSALHVWCDDAEKEKFRLAAEEEGFSNLSVWVMFHLRNQAKRTLQKRQPE